MGSTDRMAFVGWVKRIREQCRLFGLSAEPKFRLKTVMTQRTQRCFFNTRREFHYEPNRFRKLATLFPRALRGKAVLSSLHNGFRTAIANGN